MNKQRLFTLLTLAALALAVLPSCAQTPPATLQIALAQPGAKVSPTLYGLMTEEINHAYDGGLYAELIQNRSFNDDPATPAHWSNVLGGGGYTGPIVINGLAAGEIALDTSQPMSAAQPVSLKVTVNHPEYGVGAANDGYWGIPVLPNSRYRASFYAKPDPSFVGPINVDIESNDGKTVYAKGTVARLSSGWKQYTVTLTTGKVTPTADARFALLLGARGTVRFSLVSLFPPTYNNRPNGLRPDLMQKMAAMQPAFLRLPGGDGLEGDTIATRFDWKKTIGPIENRPGHPGAWTYRASDGLGLLEYLTWCEDLHIQPVLAVYAGFSRNKHINPNPEKVAPGPDLVPYVQDALDEIEYVTGGPATTWGAVRVRDGHPAPFPLNYVEIGNEDFFDKAGTYDGRFAQFFDAIKAKYPALQLIATTKVKSRVPDVIDEHYYKQAVQFEADVHHYDNYPRTGPKVFVGEWATREGVLTPNMNAALGDAVWMTGMERNSDVVVLASYAPLLTNVNPGAHQWRTDLIGYDALSSYGSPSFYAQVMFSRYLGDTIVPATLNGSDTVYDSVTRDSKTGLVYVKMVNVSGTAQPVHINITGAQSVAPKGTAVVLSSGSPTGTNSITEPTKIVPVTTPVSSLGTAFDYTLTPYSITILQMSAK